MKQIITRIVSYLRIVRSRIASLLEEWEVKEKAESIASRARTAIANFADRPEIVGWREKFAVTSLSNRQIAALASLAFIYLFLKSCGNDKFEHVARILPCDELAADPSDPNKVEGVAGISLDEIDIAHAESACRDAAEDYPNSRFPYQLARVLSQVDPYAALEQLEHAIEIGYPAAAMGLARLYADGIIVSDNEEQDADDAITLINFAKDSGYISSDADLVIEEGFWLQYFETVFTDENYHFPTFMTALYSGEKEQLNLEDVENQRRAIYTFLNIRDYCGYSGDRDALNNAGLILRGISYYFISTRGDSPLLLPSLTPNDYSKQLGIYEHDAALFVSRHGCEGPVFAHMISNSEQYYSELTSHIQVTAVFRTMGRALLDLKQLGEEADPYLR